MQIENLINELTEISGKVDLVGHDERIYILSDLADKLRGKPIITVNGMWNSNAIVKALDEISIGETECWFMIDDMIKQLMGWE